jgi:type II secretory pathway predicted ATPase ExeA
MYESYYGFAERPFSLTPDPKYLYRSQSHGEALDLLRYAIERREGFVVITGDIGAGKTTLCRALLETIDRRTSSALILNPFLSEEELLRRILQDFGVVSREELKAGKLADATKQELIDSLYEFLLGLAAREGNAVLVIDEAQNLPLDVLEQIRILSNLETDKEKLLQIILVGQLNLQTLLRSPRLRQLDQRISIRYRLQPFDRDTVASYVSHRLAVAGGSAAVTFTPAAIGLVHRLSGGIPRLINLLCDRALVAGFSVQAARITADMVRHAAESLELGPFGPRFSWPAGRASLALAAGVVLVASALAVGVTTLIYSQLAAGTLEASTAPAAAVARATRRLPPGALLTIRVHEFPQAAGSSRAVQAITDWLESSGYAAYHADLDLGANGRWTRVLAGAYTDAAEAQAAEARLRSAAPELDVRVMTATRAAGFGP